METLVVAEGVQDRSCSLIAACWCCSPPPAVWIPRLEAFCTADALRHRRAVYGGRAAGCRVKRTRRCWQEGGAPPSPGLEEPAPPAPLGTTEHHPPPPPPPPTTTPPPARPCSSPGGGQWSAAGPSRHTEWTRVEQGASEQGARPSASEVSTLPVYIQHSVTASPTDAVLTPASVSSSHGRRRAAIVGRRRRRRSRRRRRRREQRERRHVPHVPGSHNTVTCRGSSP